MAERPDFRTIGNTGLERMNGEIFEEFLPQLQGDLATKIFREMKDNDPIVGAVLFAIDMLIRQVDWKVEPASQEPQDLERADFLDSVISDMDMTFTETISEILSMLPFGFSFHEIVFKRRTDGRIGWDKIPIRAQNTIVRWEFSDNGDVEGAIQSAAPHFREVTIPINKALLFKTQANKGNPEGRSVLRNAYRPWFFKKRIEEIEGIGIERDLAGLPVAWVPPNLLSPTASADEKAIFNEIKKIVVNVRRDEQEGVVFPLVYDDSGNKLYDFSLLSTGGRRQFDTNQIVQRYDQRIAMTVLADFILLGHEKVGSFSLSSSKTNLFSNAIGAWLKSIADVFNRKAIPMLFKLNGIDQGKIPKLVSGDIENIPLDELGTYIEKLSNAGFPLFPNEALEKTLLRVANLPSEDGSTEV